MDSQTSQSKSPKYRGQVVYIYAFDLAYDMKREPGGTLLGQKMYDYTMLQSKRMPKYLFFYRPKMVTLPLIVWQGASGQIQIQRSIKVFDVGSISIQLRVPFEVERLEDLVPYHNFSFADKTVEDEVRKLAEQAKKELEPYCVKPVAQLSQEEPYTVFCIDDLPGQEESDVCAEDWLMDNRRAVAGLLTEEQEPQRLSEQEASESTSLYLSYYDKDLVVVDWDAALVIGGKDSLNDVLHIMELANVQLAELEAYDRILNSSLQAAYRDLGQMRSSAQREVIKNLREIKVDFARLSDELLNITKFFGDWHLANIYEKLSIRFHLGDWNDIIDEKLKTLGELYGMLQQDKNNFLMLVLESVIVLLFIIDLVIIIAVSK